MSILRKNSPGLPWLMIRTANEALLGCSESAYRNECYFVSQPHPLPNFGRGLRWMQARAAAGLLRLPARNVGGPVCQWHAGQIRDVLRRHPDGVIDIVDGRSGVITPSGNSRPSELWITGKAILRLVAFTRNMDRTYRRACDADKSRAWKVVWA